jgi:hypothetical protein
MRSCLSRKTKIKGSVAEWFKAAVLKTAEDASPPWVRIRPLPPGFKNKAPDKNQGLYPFIATKNTSPSLPLHPNKKRKKKPA